MTYTDCPECAGRGRVVVERAVGGVNANGPWQSYATMAVECDECHGSGQLEANNE